MGNSTEDYLDSLLNNAMGIPSPDKNEGDSKSSGEYSLSSVADFFNDDVILEPSEEEQSSYSDSETESSHSETETESSYSETETESSVPEGDIGSSDVDEPSADTIDSYMEDNDNSDDTGAGDSEFSLDSLLDQASRITDDPGTSENYEGSEDPLSDINAALSDVNGSLTDFGVDNPQDEEISSLLESIGELDDVFSGLGKESDSIDNSGSESETQENEASSTGFGDVDGLSTDFSGISGDEDLSLLLDEISATSTTEEASSSDDVELGELLSGLSDDDDLSEIGSLLDKDEKSEIVDSTTSTFDSLMNADIDSDNFDLDSILDEEQPQEETKEEKKRRKKEEKEAKKRAKKEKKKNKENDDDIIEDDFDSEEKKPGFFAKLIALFTEEIDEPEEGSLVFEQSAVDIAAEGAQENEDILAELEEEKKGKGKKKKEKKKKGKDKNDTESEGEEGSKKKKKEKKEKVKKEKQPEPPLKKLPKKKIILSTILIASIGAVIIGLSYLYPYSTDISNAKKHYVTGNYQKTYEYLKGHKLTKQNKELYKKTVVLLKVQRQLDSYRNYMKLGMKPEALNALIQGVDAMDTYAETANELGIMNEFSEISAVLITNLNNTFGVSVDQAREWIAKEGTSEYTKEIYAFFGESAIPSENEDTVDNFSPEIPIIIQSENEDNLLIDEVETEQ